MRSGRFDLLAASGIAPSPYPPAFEEVWRAYPNHGAKHDACKAYREAIREHGPALNQTILSALSWQVTQPRWRKNNGDFVPLMATWLRGKRWEDEPFHAMPESLEAQWDRIQAGGGRVS